jgi:beta-lactamase regulating signal transducer with metallopeptidase domain
MMPSIGLHLLESTVFAGIVSLLALRLRTSEPSARYAVWLAAAFKFAVPASLFSWFGIRLGSVLPASSPGKLAGAVFEALATPRAAVGSYEDAPMIAAIASVWVSGIVFMSIVWIRRSLAFRRGFDCPAAREHEVLERLRQQLHISRPIGLRASTDPGSELGLWGIWHPTIRIPRGLSTQLTAAELEAVLLHELAHVRRWDNLTGALVHTLTCLFWFHPLLWWIEKRLMAERERACDEMVIHEGAAHQAYVSGILKVCRSQLVDAVAGACGIGGSDLKRRLDLILSYRVSDRTTATPRILPAMLGFTMTILPLLSGFFQQSTVHAQQSAAGRQGRCVYNSVEYPQGTVLRMGTRFRGSTKACMEGTWTSTNKTATAVANAIPTRIPASTNIRDRAVCRPATSTAPNACACQDGSYSLGALVNGENGKMRCDQLGRGGDAGWRPATPSDLGVKQ